MGLQLSGISYFGTDVQKNELLPKLATGSIIGQLCRPDRQTVTTSLSNDNQVYCNSKNRTFTQNNWNDGSGGFSGGLLTKHAYSSKYLHSIDGSYNDPISSYQYCGDVWSLMASDVVDGLNHNGNSNFAATKSIILCTGSWSLYSSAIDQNFSKQMTYDHMPYQLYCNTVLNHQIQPVLIENDSSEIHFKNVNTLGLSGLQKQQLFLKDKSYLSKLLKNSALDCCNSDLCDLILSEEAYLIIACLTGRLKRTVNTIVQHCNDRNIFNRSLDEFSAIQAVMFEAEARLYALQSMVFFLAGMVEVRNVSARFESQLAVAFSYQLAQECLISLSSICGADIRFRRINNEHHVRNSSSQDFHFVDKCLEQIKSDISCFEFLLGDRKLLLNSLQMQMIQMLKSDKVMDDIRFIDRSDWHRNFFVSSKLKRLSKLQQLIDGENVKIGESALRTNMGLVYHLFENIHPSLQRASLLTEKAALFLCTGSRLVQNGSYCILVKGDKTLSGKDELQRQQFISFDLLLKSAFNVLVMCAVISRASRSRSIGLKNCDQEVLMANLICEALCAQVDSMLSPIKETQETKIITERVFNINDEFLYPQHPLDTS
ncbi:hypothetical protein GJ496_010208 [Pomphorhynchus laevis]|nr:hypothetical protein GJ496_010208 [Pomphorhynchus laevis]